MAYVNGRVRRIVSRLNGNEDPLIPEGAYKTNVTVQPDERYTHAFLDH